MQTRAQTRAAWIGLPLTAAAAVAAFTLFGSGETMPESAPTPSSTTGIGDGPARTDTRRFVAPVAPQAVRGIYGAPVGSLLRFEISTRQGIAMVDEGAQTDRETGYGTLKGRADLTILERSDDAVIASLCFDHVTLGSSDETAATREKLDALEADLLQPVTVRFAPSGRVVGLRFEDVSTLAQNQVRSILQTFRFVVPPDRDPRSWQTTEQDETGLANTEYAPWGDQADGLAVIRHKLGYSRLNAAGRNAEPQAEVRGQATARFSKKLGWLVAAEVDEAIRIVTPGLGVDVCTTIRGTLNLVSSDVVAATRAVDASTPWLGIATDLGASQAAVAASEEARWRARLEGVRLTDMAMFLDGMVRGGAADGPDFHKGWNDLSWLCRLDPRNVEELARMVRAKRFGDETVSVLLTAMGDAGTPETQDALAALHADQNLSEMARTAATVALVQAERPTAKALDALWKTASGAGSTTEFGRTSLLIFGALSARGDSSDRTDLLLAQEQNCEREGTIDTWIHAVGNSKDRRAIANVERHVGNESSTVRASVAVALRHGDRQRSVPILRDLARRDAEPSVRISAIESLVEHGSGSSTLQAIALHDASAEVRRAAMIGLARVGGRAGADVLRRASQQDAEQSLRQLAADLLQSQ